MTDLDTDIAAMIADGTAKNTFNASAIANLLRLWELTDPEEKRFCWQLYRQWSDLGKDKNALAELARCGIALPKLTAWEPAVDGSAHDFEFLEPTDAR